jgi:phage-related protein
MTSEAFLTSLGNESATSCTWCSTTRTPPTGSRCPSIGPGCREIRVRDETSNAYRVFYVAAVADVVYVLHCCFQKKTRQTTKSDVDLGKQRYREMKDVEQGGTP